ncbi:MAG: hypothetical protein ACLRFE_00015 [Clostridia bacterium]
MFIEDLWEKFPEQTINAVKKIFDIREERGDSLEFKQANNGALRFEKYGHCSFGIVLTDFEVYGQQVNSGYNIKWLKFMKSVFGKKYLYYYIAYRNEKLDKFMAEYEADYNNQTKKVLAELGMKQYQDELNQTK